MTGDQPLQHEWRGQQAPGRGATFHLRAATTPRPRPLIIDAKPGSFLIQQLLDEANRQIAAFRPAPPAEPDGCFDGTPDHGPMPVPVAFKLADGSYRGALLWAVHKHRWPLDFAYCIGDATDSRGERTERALIFDIRDLPRRYTGRFNLQHPDGCGRNRHRTIIGRALADGFDLHAFCREQA